MKVCAACKIEKELVEFCASEFKKKRGICRLCRKISAALYYKNNKEAINKRGKNYRINNKEKCSEIGKIYYKNNTIKLKKTRQKYHLNNRDKNHERNRKYYQNNKEKVLERTSENAYKRYKTDANYKLRRCISNSNNINHYLRKSHSSKGGLSCLKFLGYSISELKEHLERQFEAWMSWDNYGNYNSESWDNNDVSTWKWNIDHIVPQSTFQYFSMDSEEFKKCWALNNLRPLSAKQNLLKSNNIGILKHK